MTDTHTSSAPHGPAKANVQDSDDLNPRIVFFAGLGLIVIIILSCLVVGWQFYTLNRKENEAKKSHYPLGEAARNKPLSERWPVEPRLEEAEKEMQGSRSDWPPRLAGQPEPWEFPKKPRLEGLDTPVTLNDPINSGVKGWPGLAPLQAKEEDRKLARPTWVDEKEGTVTLPIDLVMKRLAPELPVRSSAVDDKVGGYYKTPSTANSGRSSEGGQR
jgi:hypothetical protein